MVECYAIHQCVSMHGMMVSVGRREDAPVHRIR